MRLPFFLLLLFAPLLSALIFGSFQMDPFTMRKQECYLDWGQEECRGHNAYHGFCVDVMAELAREMDVDYRIEIRGESGRPLGNGTWSGLISNLFEGSVDVVVAAMDVTPERAAVVDFSPPFLSSGISIMIKKPSLPLATVISSEGIDNRPSTNPYAPATWIAIVLLQIMSFGTSITLFCFMRQTERPKMRQLRCYIWVFSLLVWIGCSLVLVSSILPHLCPLSDSNETAIVHEEAETAPFQSLEELVAQEEVKYGMRREAFAHHFFMNSNDSLHKKIMKTMSLEGVNPSLTYKHEDGIERVRESNGSFAFFLDDVVNSYENMKLPCDLIKIGGLLTTYEFAVATKKGSELSGKVHSAMTSLIRSGVIERIHERWFVEKAQCKIEKKPMGKEISEAEKCVDYAIYGMIGGIAISIVVSLIVAHFEKNRNHRPVKFTDEVTPINA